MNGDLTVDNLCEAIQHFLKEVADGSRPVHANTALNLHGVPGDDTMKTVLEALGGTLTIRVHELPAMLKMEPPAASVEPGLNLWSPSKEAVKG